MQVRLLDASLNDIKGTLLKLINKLEKKYPKRNISKIPLKVIVHRGDITMANGEWLKEPKIAKNLTLNEAEIKNIFNESNLNMGLLGYGDPKDSLKGLMQWVKHNINPQKLKGDKRDLNIKIESLRPNSKEAKKFKYIILELSVPAKGMEESKDLQNTKLEKLGYVGLKQWSDEQLEAIKDSDKKLDNIIYKILTGKAELKDKVGDVLDDKN